MSGGPLAGVRVLDLTRAMAGPYATQMLADAGADVVKAERPGSGDDTRGWGPPFVGGESTYFLSVNRGKRSIVVDLASADGVARLQDLARRADVLVQNFRPGVMERLGLSDDALTALNPRLVTLSITGFGEGGPDGHRSGFDQIAQGEGGLMSLTGPMGGPPTKVGVPIADILAGMFGAFGVVAALAERARSGRGQHVSTSLLAARAARCAAASSRTRPSARSRRPACRPRRRTDAAGPGRRAPARTSRRTRPAGSCRHRSSTACSPRPRRDRRGTRGLRSARDG